MANMGIWFKSYSLDEINQRGQGTLVEHLDIKVIQIGEDFIVGTMPVAPITHQPRGILHGGASCVLAETLASSAANFVLDPSKNYAVGLEINANHIRSTRSGLVIGTAKAIHLGRSTQVWETKIQQDDKLICVSRMTLAVLAIAI
jgi:1,4-dihydroxy-2-naphthoyl-CoA hydrolase